MDTQRPNFVCRLKSLRTQAAEVAVTPRFKHPAQRPDPVLIAMSLDELMLLQDSTGLSSCGHLDTSPGSCISTVRQFLVAPQLDRCPPEVT